MIRLNLLGEIDLLGADGERIRPLLQQPKRLALLAYLALADNRAASRKRDEALLLFWPEVTEKRARNALSQTVHVLRRALGAGVIVDCGPGEFGIDTGALWCDAVAVRQALARGEWTEALRLYRGDLLAGFAISAGPEFEHWLDDERNQLRRDAATAAWKLADAAAASGQLGAAAGWGSRAVGLSLDEEPAVQRLLRLLNELGDRTGALEAYERFSARLARDYEATPSAEMRQIVAEIRARGSSRPTAEPLEANSPSPAGNAVDEPPLNHDWVGLGSAPPAPAPLPSVEKERTLTPPTARTTAAHRLNRRWVWVVGIVLCSLASVALHQGAQVHTAQADALTRIVVDSVADVGDAPRSAELGASLTSAIVDQLVRVRSFDVASESPKGGARSLPPDLPLSPHYLLTGHVLHSGDRLHVDVALTDGLSGRIVRTGAFEHPTGAPLPVIDTLAREIAALVRTTVGEETERREWRKSAQGERAYDLMQEARDGRRQAGELEQKGNFQTAVSALVAADSLLRVAERMAPQWGAPFVESAEIANELATLYMGPLRDPVRVESFLRRGIQEAGHATALHPQDPAALNTLGSLYYWYWLTVPMPPDSATRTLARGEETLRAAVSADPTRARAWNLLSASLFARADYSGAYLAATRAYAGDHYLRGSEDMLDRLFLTSYEINDDSAAAGWCREAQRRFPRSWTSSYCQLALRAWNHSTARVGHAASVDAAWTIAREGTAGAAPEPQAGPRLHMLVAAILAQNGFRDSAEAVVRRARASDPGDDELLPVEADVRIALGQRDSARALVTQYIEERPLHRLGIARGRRFRTLHLTQSDFQQQ